MSVIALAVRRGCTLNEIEASLGKGLVALETKAGRFHLEDVVKIWEACTNLSDDPFFGLTFGENIKIRDLGLVGFLIMSAPSMDKVLQNLVHYQSLISQGGFLGFNVSGNFVDIWYEPKPFRTPFSTHQIDAVLMSIVTLTKFITGMPILPVHASLVGGRPCKEGYLKLADKVVFGGYSNVISYPKEIMGYNSLYSCCEVYGLLCRNADELLIDIGIGDGFSSLVCSTIQGMFGSDNLVKEGVANSLHMSTRTMQRRLNNCGLTFQELLDFTRRQTAVNLLKQNALDVEALSLYLCFSDVSSFYKAFQRWTGLSVKQWRKKVQIS